MNPPVGVELFDFHDLSELSTDAEVRASEALQLSVADGRADGVHVGIFVTDDDSLHGVAISAALGRGK